MSNHSVIEHRACYHFVKAEEDYIAICSSGKSSPHCKALILAVLESWANTKGKDEYIYMSLPQWITATYMFYERNVIFDSLKEMLDEGLIERQPIVKFGQNTFEYRLSVKKVQELVKTLPEKVSEHLPNLDNYIAFKTRSKEGRPKKAVEKSTTSKSKSKNSLAVEKSTTSQLINQSPAVEKSTDMPLINQRNLDSNTIDSFLDSNLDSFIATAHADVNATAAFFIHPIHSHLCFDDLLHPTQMHVELIPEKHPHWTELEYKYRTRSAEEIRQELLSKGISVKVTYIEKDSDETVSDQAPVSDTGLQQTLLVDMPVTQPKQKKTAANAKEKIATDKPVKPVKAKKQPDVSKEELVLRKQVHTWVNERRGYSLQGRATAGAVLQENISCTTLANLLYRGINQNDPEGCTWGDLSREWDYIAKNDKYWKLSENKNRIGAQALLQMFAQTMPKVRQPNISINGATTPSGTMVHNEACNVAQDAIAKGKQHGYTIDAKVYSSGGGWLVNIVWDGQPLFPIESRAMWEEQFTEFHNLEQEQKKGAK